MSRLKKLDEEEENLDDEIQRLLLDLENDDEGGGDILLGVEEEENVVISSSMMEIREKKSARTKKLSQVLNDKRASKSIPRDQNVHVVFLCEVTGSMRKSYEEWKTHCTKMAISIGKSYRDFDMEVAFVGYGGGNSNNFQIMGFRKLDGFKGFLEGVRETGEVETSNVIGGIEKVLELGFDSAHPARLLIHMSNTPSSEYHDGAPHGGRGDHIKKLLLELAQMRVHYLFFQIGKKTTKMVDDFRKLYESDEAAMEMSLFNNEEGSRIDNFLEMLCSLICKSIKKECKINDLEKVLKGFLDSDAQDMFDDDSDDSDEADEAEEEEVDDDSSNDLRNRMNRIKRKDAKIHGLKVKAKAKETRKRILKDQNVHLVFLCDVTASMWNAIEQCKVNCIKIKDFVRKAFSKFEMEVAFVGYRDVDDNIMEFGKPEDLPEFLEKVKASGGGDEAEDVFGGLAKVLELELDQDHPTRLLIHMADAPCHGTEYHNGVSDYYKGGDPNGRDIKRLLGDLVDLRIHYFFIQIGNTTEKMIKKFKDIYERNEDDMELVVFKHEDDYLQLFVNSINCSIGKSQEISKAKVEKKYSEY